MLSALWILYGLLNGMTFALYGIDKRRAVRGAWRIRERTLLTFTWAMGGAGAWLGMRVFRHKTKHTAFAVSAPVAAAAQLGLMAVLTLRG